MSETAEQQAPLLIHSHIHKRQTGVTSSVKQLLQHWPQTEFEVVSYGGKLADSIPQLSTIDLWRRIKQHTQIIWHAHRNNEVMRALLFRLLHPSLKIVMTRHSATPPSWITRYLQAKVDRVIGLTPAALTQLPPNSIYIPHGVDTERYAYVAQHRPQQLGIEAEYLVGVLGRIREAKGQHIVVEAMLPLLKQRPNWKLVLLGRIKKQDLAYVEKMRQSIKAEGLEQQVIFMDEVADPRPFYTAVSILAVPSLSEGFSMVSLEGMSCGCELIAGRGVGIHDELIENGKNGWLVTPADVPAWREALQQSMQRIEQGQGLGETASRSIAEQWSIARAAERLLALYRSLLDS